MDGSWFTFDKVSPVQVASSEARKSKYLTKYVSFGIFNIVIVYVGCHFNYNFVFVAGKLIETSDYNLSGPV